MRGGGPKEVQILEGLKPHLIRIFKGEGSEILVPMTDSLHLHIRIKHRRSRIAEMDLEIGPNAEPGVFLVNDACWLGVYGNTEAEKKVPWGPWAQPTVLKKGLLIDENYRPLRPSFNFSLTCTPYPGSRYTNFLFLLFFYILKLHARYIGLDVESTACRHRPRSCLDVEDYIIAADDTAKVGDTFVTEYAVQKVLAAKMKLPEIMRTPLLYYERFGFIYPEKEEFFSNLLETGEAFVLDGPSGSKGPVSRYMLDLKTLTVAEILNRVRALVVGPR